MKYSEKEMAALISEVETQFSDHLAKAEEKVEQDLQKTEDTDVEISNDNIEVEDEEVNEVAKSEGDIELDYDDDDYVEMDKLYKSMSKAEQEAHYKSLKKSLFVEEKVIETKEVIKPIAKKEIETKEIKKTKEGKLEKKEFDVLKDENVELKETLGKLTSAFTNFVQKQPPKRKAITKIEYIKKSETEEVEEEKIDIANLNESQISERLTDKIRSGKLEKNDKEAIDNYYFSDSPSIDSIKHLL